MTPEEQKKNGLAMIEILKEDIENTLKMGDVKQARDSFCKATGVVMCMAVTGILTDAEEKEMREALYREHYVYE